PFLAHGIMISAFTFSAIAYSRISRGEQGFIAWPHFVIGIFATITLFFLVRIFDEFKDKEDDKKYRKYLPVPRGLISLKELKAMGLVVGLAQVAVIAAFQPKMLYLYTMVLAYLMLMGKEFFVSKWLKKRQLTYIASHMVIIPLIDVYSSGLDWLLNHSQPHWGLAWFFAVSYMNGMVLEFGRKIRTPETEEEGVVSYTGLYGTKAGAAIWIGLLLFTMLLAVGASRYANYGGIAIVVLSIFFVLCSLPAWLFLIRPTVKRTKYIEYASALWTALMYLSLGAMPMIKSLMLPW
ncbi:MAG: UbiA family prenyltransferase, partial [Bacteroidales bacterium]|nr:UbiA family prenyltransferase [Bacteroidales bacterium]